MSLTRRRLLGGAAALTTLAAGCLAAGTSGDGADDGGSGGTDGGGESDLDPQLRGHTMSDAVVTPDVERYSDVDAWALYLASDDAAERAFGGVDEEGVGAVEAFVEETDFLAGERLVYVHAFAPQTCYRLGLAEEPGVATDGTATVRTAVERTAPADQPCGDAITPVEVLLRLSFDRAATVPDAVTVEVTGHREDPEELVVEAQV